MSINQQPVTSLKGIGEKTGALFAHLGVETVEDLLHYYPRDYDACESPVSLGELCEGQSAAVLAVLPKTASVRRFGNMQVVLLSLKDETGSLQLTWYRMPYLRTVLQEGRRLVFRGRVVKKNNRLTMEQPEIFSPEDYEVLTHALQPIYGQTKGLGNKAIVRAVTQALAQRTLEQEYLPAQMRKRYELSEYNYALEHIHFPESKKELLFARKRLVFDEFFFFLLMVRRLKERRQDKPSPYVMEHKKEIDRLSEALPYELTDAQQRALREVQQDLEGGMVMNRLIQGDVGSGKTIIAVMALLQAAFNGFQGAMMAPTEVLARQHYEMIDALLKTHQIDKQVVLVTGSMTAKERREAYRAIAQHEADIIVGTHALIQEKVEYAGLALVITDEQHRFGVGQRQALGEKGREPHVLVMSATPIPRTLAIILYGDLDISVIDQLPAKRLPIKNCVVNTSFRENAYRFITREAKQGHQSYVICPMVEPSEMIEAENVIDYAAILRKELPSEIVVEFLHGKMKAKEKNRIMERFASGEIQVLVSTTVVEVGINVPNATVMMIENAERFGLAQLHQLRGRVGRGSAQSYCIMVDASGQEGTRERLDILNRSNDGFWIASEDLKLRGPGDIFGLRQSGDMEFRLADIYTDAALLKQVSEEVNRLLEEDPQLSAPEHRLLRERLEILLERSSGKLNL